MNTYVVLLRGVNVGGKNSVSMAGVRDCLEELGFSRVSTYAPSGNLLFDSDKGGSEIQALIEGALPKRFALDDELVRALVLTGDQLQAVVDDRPTGFGERPAEYHSDAIFLMGIDSSQAMRVFDPREGVDRVWAGDGVIYSQRLSSLRTKSRLSRIIGTPEYRSVTIRSWSTTMKLSEMLVRRSTEGRSA